MALTDLVIEAACKGDHEARECLSSLLSKVRIVDLTDAEVATLRTLKDRYEFRPIVDFVDEQAGIN